MVSEASSVDYSFQSVAEDMRIVAVIETPFQFLKVSVQVLGAHLVEGSDDGPLKQAPDALDAVGMNVTHNPLLRRMANGLMASVVIGNAQVRLQFVGIDGLSLILDGPVDEVMQGMAFDIGDPFDSNLTAPLDGPSHPGLVALVGVSLAFGATTYQCLIYFHDPEQGRAFKGVISHSLSDAVAQIPCRLIGDAQSTVKLVGAHALLRLAHEVDRQEPLSQGQVRVVHNRSGSDGELISAILTTPLVIFWVLGRSHSSAACTGNAVRPPQLFQGVGTCLI